MFEEQLKQWIRDNLEIKITYPNHGDNACYFELWLVGDKKPFSSDSLYLGD